VVVDLDPPGADPRARIERASDPERGISVVAVSRDPALAALALAAGADFALLPRDQAWLSETLRREGAAPTRSMEPAAPPPGPGRLVVDVPPEGLPFEEFERRVIELALARSGWNRSRAARELGISRPRLLRKIERHGLRPPLAGPDSAS
jgi:transcriptional regulator with GAF, ATPase, and Fis domain